MDDRAQSKVVENTGGLAGFFQAGRQIKCVTNQIILSPGIDPEGVYLIEDGFIKVYSISPRGETYLHIIYKSGEIFPLTWAIQGTEHDIFYETIGATRLRRAPKEDFLRFIRSDSEAAYALLEQFAVQFDIHIRRVENLQHRHADERVAHRLLTLAKRFGQERNGQIIIEGPISHQLIADSINLTRESVSREIERLNEQGIIQYTNRKIVIKDPEALAGIFE